TCFMELNKATPTNDLVRGITTLTYAGTLVVTNLAGTLAANNTFKIFDAVTYTGSFNTTNLPPLGGGLVWDTAGLTNNGTIKVLSTGSSQPQIGTVFLSGTNFIFSGTGGTAGSNYWVLTSTNVALPLVSWTAVATNQFVAGGNFNVTNGIKPGVPNLFYILKVP
ncbi:MAG TPA: hypothetical protein VNM37_28700, partial [Candidatus Dormibacteraeota bacterium]|nr:hypothetical protein [Candidatus Dormibacteraeota bacterium]